jgi:hypothetical protein
VGSDELTQIRVLGLFVSGLPFCTSNFSRHKNEYTQRNVTATGLDFSEILSSKPPSKDPDAFEKFPKQFLELVHGAAIITTIGRGPDREVDLIAQVLRRAQIEQGGVRLPCGHPGRSFVDYRVQRET